MFIFNNKKKLFGLFLILFFLLSLFNIKQANAVNKKVVLIGSSTFRRGCDAPYGFEKILEKELPNYDFNCKLPKSKMGCDYFREQFMVHVSGKGFDELILYAGLNGIFSQKRLEECKSDLSIILEQAQKEKMRVIVVGAQAFKDGEKTSKDYIYFVKENNKWLKNKPFGIDVYIDLYSAVDKNDDDAIDDGLGDADNLHLISGGNKILADLIIEQGYGIGGHEIQIIENTQASSDSENDFRLVEPQIQITIPGLNFTPIDFIEKYSSTDESGQYLFFPYIGEYISSIYRYGTVAGGVITIVMIIIAGFQWVTSGGNAAQTQKAKTRITQAVVGLIILVGSYLILYTLNPNLVEFKNLKIKLTAGINFEELAEQGFDNGDSSIPDTPEYIVEATCADEADLVDITGMIVVSGGARKFPYLHKDVIAPLKKAKVQAKEQGVEISVVSAARTMAYQQKLWEAALKKYGNDEAVARKKVCKPSCNCPHLTGRAVDLCIKGSSTCSQIEGKFSNLNTPDVTKLQNIMRQAGWKRYCGEWWHFEYGLDLPKRCSP